MSWFVQKSRNGRRTTLDASFHVDCIQASVTWLWPASARCLSVTRRRGRVSRHRRTSAAAAAAGLCSTPLPSTASPQICRRTLAANCRFRRPSCRRAASRRPLLPPSASISTENFTKTLRHCTTNSLKPRKWVDSTTCAELALIAVFYYIKWK